MFRSNQRASLGEHHSHRHCRGTRELWMFFFRDQSGMSLRNASLSTKKYMRSLRRTTLETGHLISRPFKEFSLDKSGKSIRSGAAPKNFSSDPTHPLFVRLHTSPWPQHCPRWLRTNEPVRSSPHGRWILQKRKTRLEALVFFGEECRHETFLGPKNNLERFPDKLRKTCTKLRTYPPSNSPLEMKFTVHPSVCRGCLSRCHAIHFSDWECRTTNSYRAIPVAYGASRCEECDSHGLQVISFGAVCGSKPSASFCLRNPKVYIHEFQFIA